MPCGKSFLFTGYLPARQSAETAFKTICSTKLELLEDVLTYFKLHLSERILRNQFFPPRSSTAFRGSTFSSKGSDSGASYGCELGLCGCTRCPHKAMLVLAAAAKEWCSLKAAQDIKHVTIRNYVPFLLLRGAASFGAVLSVQSNWHQQRLHCFWFHPKNATMKNRQMDFESFLR